MPSNGPAGSSAVPWPSGCGRPAARLGTSSPTPTRSPSSVVTPPSCARWRPAAPTRPPPASRLRVPTLRPSWSSSAPTRSNHPKPLASALGDAAGEAGAEGVDALEGGAVEGVALLVQTLRRHAVDQEGLERLVEVTGRQAEGGVVAIAVDGAGGPGAGEAVALEVRLQRRLAQSRLGLDRMRVLRGDDGADGEVADVLVQPGEEGGFVPRDEVVVLTEEGGLAVVGTGSGLAAACGQVAFGVVGDDLRRRVPLAERLRQRLRPVAVEIVERRLLDLVER